MEFRVKILIGNSNWMSNMIWYTSYINILYFKQNMATIKDIYDHSTAQHYDQDLFDIFATAHQHVLSQIQKHLTVAEPTVLDLAMWTGSFLKKVKNAYPQAKLFGIDISQQMINLAHQKVDVQAVCDDVNNLESHFQSDYFDLLSVHFLLAYIDLETVLLKANKVLKKDGYLSFATSLMTALPNSQKLFMQFVNLEHPEVNKIPMGIDALLQQAEKAGYSVCEKEILKIDLNFANADEFYNFAYNQGWLAQYISEHLDANMIEYIKKVTAQFFPFQDTHEIAIVLLRKK